MVLRIFRSTICRPSNFHKPSFCTSQMQKTTRPDRPEDEARRKENQKIIDYTFGPPTLHEQETITSDLAGKEEEHTHLMKNMKEKPLQSARSALGQNAAQEVHQQEAYRMNPQSWPRQQYQEAVERGTTYNLNKEHYYQTPSSRFGESSADSSYYSHHVGCPHYYRQMEAEMYDNFAQKYLKLGPEELDKLDKLLAKEMENLELPEYERKGMRAWNDSYQNVDPHSYRISVQTQPQESNPSPPQYHQYQPLPNQCQSGQYQSNVNYMTTVSSVEDTAKLQGSPKGYDETLDVTQCSELPLDLVPGSSSSLTDQLELYENQPTHFLLPAPFDQDKGVEWGDITSQIIEPIDGPDTICQIRALHPEAVVDIDPQEVPVVDIDPQEVRVADIDPQEVPVAEHTVTVEQMIQETEGPHGVNYINVNIHPQLETKTKPDLTGLLTKINLKTNISEHNEQHQRSHAQDHLKIDSNNEPLKPWTEERLNKIMKENIAYKQKLRADPSSQAYTATESRTTVQSLVDAAQHRHQQQIGVNPSSQVGSKERQRPDSITRHFVHAPEMSCTETTERMADSVEDIMTTIRLDKNLSLSELLDRVRAFNRLQYCRECGAVAWKKCPPSDRPECPPPPECAKACPPPKQPSQRPCPPKPCAPPQPTCPPPKSKPTCPPPKPTCPPPKSKPTCPPPKPQCPKPKPACPPPKPSCPPPQPMCPPPKPQCPGKSGPSKCPPPSKCCCVSTDPDQPVTVGRRGSVQALQEGKLLEYAKKLISDGLLKLKRTASLDRLVFTASRHNVDTATLQLNRVKDYEPWVPLPSWPYPVPDNKIKLQCPYHGCPQSKPGPVRPNCPPLPCSGFPKRLTFSPVI